MRLQKYMADCGVASRRKCEEYIARGRVTVNGQTAALGAQITDTDTVKLDGEVIERCSVKLYFLFYKPYGVITSASDPQMRPVVTDYFRVYPRLFPVGRLDYDTSGLLIMTNDGELANRLTHPRYGIVKTYRARLASPLSAAEIKALKSGAELDGRLVTPDFVKTAGERDVIIGVHDGRNREVRRLLEAAGKQVLSLAREAIGALTLSGLEPGGYRAITESELDALKKSVGIN